MSPKDTFSKEQAEWINVTMPNYLQKVGKTKTCPPRQHEPKDDRDLANWVVQCRKEFFVKFKAELEVSMITIPEWKRVSCETYAIFKMVPDAHHICKQFNQKYYNKKSQTPH